MLKKVLIGLGAIVLLLILVFAYMNYRSRTLSPAGKAELEVNDLKVEINYSRPSVRERVIFGTEESGAIQPYGTYWRLGANEATEMTVNKDITFNGEPLAAGTYRLYAIPGQTTFRIGVNTELGKWGAWEPEYSKDVLITEVPVTTLDVPVEQFTTRIEAGPDNGATVYFEWSDVQLAIPIGQPND
ncbi:DUF2911 domain-containing protein [Pararhodonellum marinum]|uniref:DUF2911 domain-containing protein n=1 Tax=Pararhodonellum marinum TaxID=2755358 RepID=UPI00188EAFDE|nr:DUF2911 domain-containing protein [Pararhodonellum marinum]